MRPPDPVGGSRIDHLTEQTRTNMSQPRQRPGTAVGDERHVLETLWRVGWPWVCAVSALVLEKS